jgi:Protein of unknown function (DUF1566)
MQPRMYARRFMMGLLSLGLLVGAALLASPAQAVDANGPYYANPAWDQKLPSSTRFVVLLDWSSQAVLDRETGLVWEKSPQTTTSNWFGARGVCTGKTVGNRKGWRLPSMAELASLIDPSVAAPGPKLPTGHPFTNVLLSNYWSATSHPDVPTNAWQVVVNNGNVDVTLKTDPNGVWCVRGGMNAEAY